MPNRPMDAASGQYTETGTLTDEARQALIAKAVADLAAIQEQQEKKKGPIVRLDLDRQFELLQQKRERYERRRKNKAFGLKRHRQKRLVGKRGHRETRLWEQTTMLKHAYASFKGVPSKEEHR